jgi:hypothetical protein
MSVGSGNSGVSMMPLLEYSSVKCGADKFSTRSLLPLKLISDSDVTFVSTTSSSSRSIVGGELLFGCTICTLLITEPLTKFTLEAEEPSP